MSLSLHVTEFAALVRFQGRYAPSEYGGSPLQPESAAGQDAVRDTASQSTAVPRGKKGSHKRGASRRSSLRFAVAGLIIVAAIGYLIYAATQGGSEYYVTTGELKAMGNKAIGQSVRLGGRVVDGSVRWDRGSSSVAFDLTDGEGTTIPITYRGTIPDSFQPNVDVIVEGKLEAGGSFKATTLLAKCASKYTPER